MADAAQRMAETLGRLRPDGQFADRADPIVQSGILDALAVGFVAEHQQTKPCRECGSPRHDYRYFKITQGGRLFLDAWNRRTGETTDGNG